MKTNRPFRLRVALVRNDFLRAKRAVQSHAQPDLPSGLTPYPMPSTLWTRSEPHPSTLFGVGCAYVAVHAKFRFGYFTKRSFNWLDRQHRLVLDALQFELNQGGDKVSSFGGGIRRTRRRAALAARTALPRSCGSVPPAGHILWRLVETTPYPQTGQHPKKNPVPRLAGVAEGRGWAALAQTKNIPQTQLHQLAHPILPRSVHILMVLVARILSSTARKPVSKQGEA